MANESKKTDDRDILDPEDVASAPVSASPSTPENEDKADVTPSTDPADEIPVPIAMSAAEIDERAQAVEAVRGKPEPDSRPDA